MNAADDRWEQIGQLLGAEAQGRTFSPHISKRTLFGISSSVEEQMASIAAEVARAAEGKAQGADDADCERERSELVDLARAWGCRLLIGRADRYFIYRSRALDYDIPPYPYARSGQLMDFLEDAGVEDVPSWYEQRGLDRGLVSKSVLVVLGDTRGGYRERFARGLPYVDESRFLPLGESHFIERASSSALGSVLSAAKALVASVQ